MTDQQWRDLARSQYQDPGSIEIDDDAKISIAPTDPGTQPDGVYVAAWVWVDYPNT